MKNLKLTILTVIVALSSLNSMAKDEIKLKRIMDEVIVDITPEEAWKVINSYGDVGAYHTSILSSRSMNGSQNEGEIGCERECTIDNGNKDIVVVEKIIDYREGEYYRYEVTKSDNFPIQKFYNTFGVKVNDLGQTVIYVITEYRLDPGFMIGLFKNKLAKGNHQALIAYKHYMETGEKNADPKMLKKKYKNS